MVTKIKEFMLDKLTLKVSLPLLFTIISWVSLVVYTYSGIINRLDSLTLLVVNIQKNIDETNGKLEKHVARWDGAHDVINNRLTMLETRQKIIIRKLWL